MKLSPTDDLRWSIAGRVALQRNLVRWPPPCTPYIKILKKALKTPDVPLDSGLLYGKEVLD
jgi:hypothetical protein